MVSPSAVLSWGQQCPTEQHGARFGRAGNRQCPPGPGWGQACPCGGSAVLCPMAVPGIGARRGGGGTCGVPCSRAERLHLSSRCPDPKVGPQPMADPAWQSGLCLGQGSDAGLQLGKHGINLPCASYLRCQMFILLF